MEFVFFIPCVLYLIFTKTDKYSLPLVVFGISIALN